LTYVLYCSILYARTALSEYVLGVDNWALLVVKLSGRALDVRVQLLLFVLWKDYRVGRRELKFEPYRYGPWSRDLQNILDRLVSEGYLNVEEVEREREDARHTGVMRVYTLTEKGLERIKKREPLLALINFAAYITVRQWAKAPLRYLIGHVYITYPEYTVGSLLLGEAVKELEDSDKASDYRNKKDHAIFSLKD
jgi:DNA-binding PadR family transcriptional regulator